MSLYLRTFFESGDIIKVIKYSFKKKYIIIEAAFKVGSDVDAVEDPENVDDWVDSLEVEKNKLKPKPAIRKSRSRGT